MNLVFSFDSILSAIAITEVFVVLALAIAISGLLMLVLADRVTNFLEKNRQFEVLGLFVLLIVGVVLLGEGGHEAGLTFFGYHVEPLSKTTFYFSIAVLVLVDIVQTRYQAILVCCDGARKRPPQPPPDHQRSSPEPSPSKTSDEPAPRRRGPLVTARPGWHHQEVHTHARTLRSISLLALTAVGVLEGCGEDGEAASVETSDTTGTSEDGGTSGPATTDTASSTSASTGMARTGAPPRSPATATATVMATQRRAGTPQRVETATATAIRSVPATRLRLPE